MQVPTHHKRLSTLIFDLGGVFIELTGVSTMLEWTNGRFSVDELWDLWFTSKGVKLFETGQTNSVVFAESIIDEFRLPVNHQEFLLHFSSWSNILFPGTRKLLSSLKNKYTLVSLSNTNHIHWNNICDFFHIDRYFDYNFPSHLTGKLKPDIDTYEFVIQNISTPPDEMIFFDDNRTNIINATNAGITSYQVSGIDQLYSKINELELL